MSYNISKINKRYLDSVFSYIKKSKKTIFYLNGELDNIHVESLKNHLEIYIRDDWAGIFRIVIDKDDNIYYVRQGTYHLDKKHIDRIWAAVKNEE